MRPEGGKDSGWGEGKERENSEKRMTSVEFYISIVPATFPEARSLKLKSATQRGSSSHFRAQENHHRARQNGSTSSGLSLLSH